MLLLIGCTLLLPVNLMAQDPQFGHFYTNSLLYNPAFTGNTDLGRFSLSYRDQWPAIPGRFVSYAGSYDHYLNNLNSGIGVQFVRDEAGSGGLTTNMVNLLYSYQVRLNRKIAMIGGIKGGVVNRRYDFEKFVFADEIARDGTPSAGIPGFRDQLTYANFGAGALIYHQEKYWGGFSVDHINQPNNSFQEGGDAFLPILYSVQGGYNIEVLSPFGSRSRGIVTLAGLYKAQLKWDQLDIGAYYRTDPILFGIWYRGLPIKDNESSRPNVDALLFMVGMHHQGVSVAYSYDVTISALSGNTAGSHEISLILEYPRSKRKRRRFFRVPCPKF